MKNILILIALFLSIGFVYADTIQSTNIHVKLYNSTMEMNNSQYSANNQLRTFNITNDSITFIEFDFPILFISNVTNENMDYAVKWTSCEVEKGKFDVAWTTCNQNLNTCQSTNNATLKDDLSLCNVNRRTAETELQTSKDKVTSLEQNAEKTKNTWFFCVIGGLIAGVVVLYAFQGKFSQLRDKSHEDFNPRMSA
jgi:hypothetical protein